MAAQSSRGELGSATLPRSLPSRAVPRSGARTAAATLHQAVHTNVYSVCVCVWFARWPVRGSFPGFFRRWVSKSHARGRRIILRLLLVQATGVATPWLPATPTAQPSIPIRNVQRHTAHSRHTPPCPQLPRVLGGLSFRFALYSYLTLTLKRAKRATVCAFIFGQV